MIPRFREEKLTRRRRLPLLALAGCAVALPFMAKAAPNQPADVPTPIADSAKPNLRTDTDPMPAPAAPSVLPAPSILPAGADPAVPADPSTPAPSQNATINLINLMVKRNLITKEDADGLIKQAELEAETARAQAQAAQATADRALAIQQSAPAAPAPAATPDDELRIPYVPDVVKKQLTDQIETDVMKQTHDEQVNQEALAGTAPDWVKRFRVAGDIRTRYEGDFYPSGNDNVSGSFFNFNSINTSSTGINIAPSAAPGTSTRFNYSQYNVDQNRNRFRLRARIGAGIDLDDGFSAGMRIATGSDDNPVTENQTLGGVNGFTQGQGGNFGKYAIWLDRAFIRYELGGQPDEDLSFTVGRFDNPFMHTSMIWSDDLAFDGAVVQGRYQVADGVVPFLTAGGFPVYNTDLNFSSNQTAKFSSEDKYLLGAQGGSTFKINKDFSFKGAVAYYDFENIEGKVSDPILSSNPNTPNSTGNTDDTRPTFAQNGNTYMALRDFEDPNPADMASFQNQYFGLATPFHEVAVTGQIDFSHYDPFHVSLTGEVVRNIAFDRNSILNNGSPQLPGPFNNLNGTTPDTFAGGDMGYMMHLDLGRTSLEKLWDWNLSFSYRYVQTDATVDGFTDSDFGGSLTGTNLEGYTIGGNLALSPRVWLGLRWMSADAIVGPTYQNDLVLFDLNAKF